MSRSSNRVIHSPAPTCSATREDGTVSLLGIEAILIGWIAFLAPPTAIIEMYVINGGQIQGSYIFVSSLLACLWPCLCSSHCSFHCPFFGPHRSTSPYPSLDLQSCLLASGEQAQG